MEALLVELDRQAGLASGLALNTLRQAHVGSGERSDKRRTYRFRDDVVLDHLTGKSCSLAHYMKGGMNRLW